jgi:hypothetical protein
MSEPSNKSARSVTESLAKVPDLDGDAPRPSRRVMIWATAGGLILALQVYVWIRWITGPYFERVDPGPTDPPQFMKVALILWQIGSPALFPVAIWWFIIRPWRRERRITLDGMIMVSTGLFFFQDPLLNYINTWCTYNAWAFNMGSWAPHVPGWLSPERPGAQVAEPLGINVSGYAYGVLLCTILGCWVMRKAQQRWPNIGTKGLIAVAAVFGFVFDFIMEGLILMPLGMYTFPGAIQSLSINAGTYYQWPIYEGLMWGGVQAALCCLRFFTDDRGRTVVERGLDNVRGGFAKQQFIRFLAIFAAISASFFVFYIIPAQFMATHADPWPEDVQKRSYFTSGLCGEGTDRPCPDPSLPFPTRHSGYINTDGEFVLPDGVEMPTVVPHERGR